MGAGIYECFQEMQLCKKVNIFRIKETVMSVIELYILLLRVNMYIQINMYLCMLVSAQLAS